MHLAGDLAYYGRDTRYLHPDDHLRGGAVRPNYDGAVGLAFCLSRMQPRPGPAGAIHRAGVRAEDARSGATRAGGSGVVGAWRRGVPGPGTRRGQRIVDAAGGKRQREGSFGSGAAPGATHESGTCCARPGSGTGACNHGAAASTSGRCACRSKAPTWCAGVQAAGAKQRTCDHRGARGTGGYNRAGQFGPRPGFFCGHRSYRSAESGSATGPCRHANRQTADGGRAGRGRCYGRGRNPASLARSAGPELFVRADPGRQSGLSCGVGR